VGSFAATLAPDTTLVVNIRLRPAEELPAVVVNERAQRPMLARTGFYERERSGLGDHIRPEAVDSLRSLMISPTQMLRNLPGLDIKCGTIGCSVQSRTAPGCLNVFVNGAFVGRNPGDLDANVSVSEVGAIEVYRHISEVPAEFEAPLKPKAGRMMSIGSGCGALAVWTVTRTMP
jgi:hypothetical protein